MLSETPSTPLWGSAADIIKVAMIDVHKAFQQETPVENALQVHDELVFDVHKDELEIIQSIIQQKMENAVQLSVPLEVDMGTGC